MADAAEPLYIPEDALAVHEVDLPANTIQAVIARGGRGLSSTFEVLVHSADSPIYYTVDGSDPEVQGQQCYVLPAAVNTQDTSSARTSTRGVLKFITAEHAVISVTRY